MVLVSVADGSIRPFKPYPGTPFSRLSLSPDARYVVYDYPAQGTSGQHDIFIVDTARGEETPLVRRASQDRNPFFTPDGTGVVFVSNEGGSIGLWYQRVAQGQAQGSPVLLKSDLGNPLGIGFTTNGTFYYHASDVPQPKLYTATLDIENGAVTIPASVVTQRPALSVLWSPDGRYLAYRSYRPPWRSTPDAEIIAIRALDTGEERDFAPGLGPLGLTSWSPDSRSLLIRGGLAPRASFYRFDVETGARTLLFSDTSGWNSVSERWFPNQESVTYVREDSSGRSIVVRQLETGRELELYKPPASTQLSRQLAVSANGRHIAFHATNLETRTMSVMVMTVTGEKPRELGPPVALPEAIDQIFAVTPDGRYVLYSSRNRDSGIFKFWRVPVDGGAPKEIPFPLRIRREFDFYMVSLHPDGKQIAFAAEAPAPATRTVWALENFLPKASAER
jgi:Tol biopolymer transport system component